MSEFQPQQTYGHHNAPVEIDTWGTLDYLNENQREILSQFLKNVSVDELKKVKFDVETIESASLRFLRARNFSLVNAVQLYKDCLKRKSDGKASIHAESNPDMCLRCDLEGLKKFYPHTTFGFDKFRRPILYEQSGGVDGNAIHQMTTTERLIAYHWYSMEKGLNELFSRAQSMSDSPVPISTCVILDLTGLNSHHCSSKVLDHVKALVSLDNTCYPELLGKMFVINSPWLAVQLWEMCKNWLDIRTQQKIEILGSGSEMMQRLAQFITPENLPPSLGGTFPEKLEKQKPNTEYVHVPRSGVIKKTVFLPSNKKKLVLENYVTDGEISLEIYYRQLNHHPNGKQESTPQPHYYFPHSSASNNYFHEIFSISDWKHYFSGLQSESGSSPWIPFLKKELKNPLEIPATNPLRVIVELNIPEHPTKNVSPQYSKHFPIPVPMDHFL